MQEKESIKVVQCEILGITVRHHSSSLVMRTVTLVTKFSIRTSQPLIDTTVDRIMDSMEEKKTCSLRFSVFTFILFQAYTLRIKQVDASNGCCCRVSLQIVQMSNLKY